MKTNFIKAPSESLKFFHPQNVLQKMSFSQYDEEPTIMYISNNRQSFQSRNSKIFANNHNKISAKLPTYESNLMQSSPERSQNEVGDGEFVCKYLTPIKKQQFHKLLFKDEINQSPQTKTKLKAQSRRGQKSQRLKSTNNHIHQNNNSRYHQHSKTNYKNSNQCKMIESFLPYQSFSQLQQTGSLKKQLNNFQKHCNCQLKSQIIAPHKGIFVDPCSQINFLKLNNQDLFSKLQKQIQKNVQLQSQILTLKKQNQRILTQNQSHHQKILKMQKSLQMYQNQRSKYLANELKEFQFVKEVLLQKKRSKSKVNKPKTQALKNENIVLGQEKMLRQTIKQQSFINLSKINILNEKNIDSKQTSFTNLQLSLTYEKRDRTRISAKKQRVKSIQNKQNCDLQRYLQKKLHK